MYWWLVLQDLAYLHKPILSIQANKKMFIKLTPGWTPLR
jgi:hypothetical protein